MSDERVIEEERLVAVSALMHDIGKFMQRGNRFKRDFPHPKYSEMFFYPETGFNISESADFINGVKFLVSHHHEKDLDKSGGSGRMRVLAEIISEADNISSREREELKGRNLPLMKPILEQIKLPDKSLQSSPESESSKNASYHFKITPLSFSEQSETVIPENSAPSDKEIESLYKEHWRKFLDEFKLILGRTNGKMNPDVLYYAMEKYLWCVPSAYFNSMPDVSLFEHSKITSAVAVSMFRALKALHPEIFTENDSSKVRKLVKDNSEKRYLLVGIDVNGIQKFIYSISSKKALKSLKGRSLYVQFIANLLVHTILWDKEINLYESNIVYMGGGKAYLILPVTAKERLEDLANEIEKALFKKFGESLSVTIGWVEASAYDFMRNSISDTWKRLMDTFAERRTRKYTNIIESDFEQFFSPEESGGYFGKDETGKNKERVICEICRKEIPASEAITKDGVTICKECNTYIEIGDMLKNDDLYAVITDNGGFAGNGVEISVGELPVRIYLTRTSKKMPSGSKALVLNMSSTDFSRADGFMLNSGGKPPVNELSDFLTGEDGFKRIGILKMDVDNLGTIMSRGIKKENRTLSRISQLSSAISIFFKGHLREILMRNEFKKSVYVIYAGGDDLFAVGNWRMIPEFAKAVREDFKRYVCGNPFISISGGIFLIEDKYPIARGASYADEAEEEAKSYLHGDAHQKDAIYFLGKPLSWNDFKISEAMKEKLVNYTESEEKKSVIQKLKKIYRLYEQSLNVLSKNEISEKDIERKARWSKWVWMLAYYTGRDEKNRKILSEIREALAKDEFNEMRSEKQIISYLDVPANWADLLTRKNKEVKNG